MTQRTHSDEAAEQRPVGDKSGDDQRVDGQPRRAGHERCNQDGGDAVAFVLDGARGHDGRHGACIGREQRDECLAVESDRAHRSVGDQRRARQVARVFKNADKEEEQQDLRQEDQHCLHAIPQTVAHQLLQPGNGDSVCDLRSEHGKTVAYPVAEWLADR